MEVRRQDILEAEMMPSLSLNWFACKMDQHLLPQYMKALVRNHSAFALISGTVFLSGTLPKGPAPSLDLSIQLYPETSASLVRSPPQALGMGDGGVGKTAVEGSAGTATDEKRKVHLPTALPQALLDREVHRCLPAALKHTCFPPQLLRVAPAGPPG